MCGVLLGGWCCCWVKTWKFNCYRTCTAATTTSNNNKNNTHNNTSTCTDTSTNTNTKNNNDCKAAATNTTNKKSHNHNHKQQPQEQQGQPEQGTALLSQPCDLGMMRTTPFFTVSILVSKTVLSEKNFGLGWFELSAFFHLQHVGGPPPPQTNSPPIRC